jgi:peptide/nickel transport system permease protein
VIWIVLRFLVRRLLWMVPTLLGITLVVFVAMHAAPGDASMLRAESSESSSLGSGGDRARFRAEHLLDQPAWKQYLHALGPFDLSPEGHRWFGGSGATPWHGLLALSFGREFHRPDVDVGDEIARRLEVTVPLSLASIAIAYALAIPIGVRSARRRGTRGDRTITALLLGLYSVPTFWCGLLLVLAFGAAGLGWLPVIGLHDREAASFGPLHYAWDALLHGVLPVAALTLGSIAYLARQTRSAMIETLSQDYVRALRARGIGERAIVWKHALRNAALPLVTLFASVFPLAIGGSVIIESIFGLPGMGRYAYEGVLMRDSNVVFATTMLSAVMTLAGILVADVLYALCDPRVRHE